jgi:hypothetical protein
VTYVVLYRRPTQLGLMREWKYYHLKHAAVAFAERLEDTDAMDIVVAELSPLTVEVSE